MTLAYHPALTSPIEIDDPAPTAIAAAAALHRYATYEAALRGLTKADVFGRSRERRVVAARHAVIHRLRADGNTPVTIGHLLDLDRATIRHALLKSGTAAETRRTVVHKVGIPVDCLRQAGA